MTLQDAMALLFTGILFGSAIGLVILYVLGRADD